MRNDDASSESLRKPREMTRMWELKSGGRLRASFHFSLFSPHQVFHPSASSEPERSQIPKDCNVRKISRFTDYWVSFRKEGDGDLGRVNLALSYSYSAVVV